MMCIMSIMDLYHGGTCFMPFIMYHDILHNETINLCSSMRL